MHVHSERVHVRVSYRILSWGGKNRMIACVPTWGVWGHAPQENLKFKSSQIASDVIWDKLLFNTCDKTIITIRISRFLGGRGIPAPQPPPYETLYFLISCRLQIVTILEY